MARIEESVEIKCPVDKVFAYTTDAESWPKRVLQAVFADVGEYDAQGVKERSRQFEKHS